MSNIRIDLEATVINGQTLTFKSPVDCSQITGLKVYYPEGDAVKSRVFQFADAHGNNVGNINLFAENVLVKVILDTDLNRAYVQNADTNTYLEGKFKSFEDHTNNKSNPHGVTKSQVGLGSVDNTSDSAKPVSTAQATAIADAKSAGTTAQTNLNTHTSNKSNPHSVTKSQVGLGNVPNVATNDQTPTYSAASTLATLTSGEKLSVSMGKIMKAIADLISHIGNKSNPHGVTSSQVGAMASNPPFIELWPNTTAGHGGVIDFHYNGDSADNTSRIIELAKGTLDVNGSKFSNNNMEVQGTIKEGGKLLSDKYAPEGYGLGKQVPPVMADANAITPAQFFRVTTNTANLNNTSHWSGIVMPYTEDEIVQFFVQTTRGTARLRRTEDGGATWTDLYMNPRLVSGKEYATTETNDDDIVYVKKIRHTTTTDFGVTNGAREISIAHDITNLDRLVRITGVLSKVYPLPFISDTGATVSIKSVTSTNIVLRAVNGVWEAGLMEFDLYYTKTE